MTQLLCLCRLCWNWVKKTPTTNKQTKNLTACSIVFIAHLFWVTFNNVSGLEKKTNRCSTVYLVYYSRNGQISLFTCNVNVTFNHWTISSLIKNKVFHCWFDTESAAQRLWHWRPSWGLHCSQTQAIMRDGGGPYTSRIPNPLRQQTISSISTASWGHLLSDKWGQVLCSGRSLPGTMHFDL